LFLHRFTHWLKTSQSTSIIPICWYTISRVSQKIIFRMLSSHLRVIFFDLQNTLRLNICVQLVVLGPHFHQIHHTVFELTNTWLLLKFDRIVSETVIIRPYLIHLIWKVEWELFHLILFLQVLFSIIFNILISNFKLPFKIFPQVIDVLSIIELIDGSRNAFDIFFKMYDKFGDNLSYIVPLIIFVFISMILQRIRGLLLL